VLLTFSINRSLLDIATTAKFMQMEHLPKTQAGREWLSEACFTAAEQMYIETHRPGKRWRDTRDVKTRISDTDVDAYAVGCALNTMRSEVKRYVPILDDEETKEYSYGVHTRVAAFVDTSLDTVLDSEEAVSLVNEFLLKHDELLIEHGVDLWRVFNAARKMNAVMVDKLHELVKEHNLGALIEGILLNVFCLERLDALFKERALSC